MKNSNLISFSLVLIITGCSHQFDDYPPSKYLSNKDQRALLNQFVITNEKIDVVEMSREDLDMLAKMFELRYYFEHNHKHYFMITREGHFFSSGLRCYGGEIRLNNKIHHFIKRL